MAEDDTVSLCVAVQLADTKQSGVTRNIRAACVAR